MNIILNVKFYIILEEFHLTFEKKNKRMKREA